MDDKPQDSTLIEQNIEHYGFRDGNLFVVDVSPEMFEKPSEDKPSHFDECLNAYARILSQKLIWNTRDWMGLVFYNSTKKWDHDPETEQILTVQKFAEVECNMLSEINYIMMHKKEKEDYCDPSVNVKIDNCLHDVLWQACRSFDSIKIAMPLRQVVLLTCRDNPLADDEAECHKIRLRAKTYADINVNLRIIGLGDDWNYDLFYKDIDMLASNIEAEDTRRTRLEDLEVQVKFPARTSGHLKWRITEDYEISTFLTTFSSKTRFLKKARMHKDTNEILESHRHWGPSQDSNDDSEAEDEDEDIVKTQIPDHVRKGFTCGKRLISFLPKEIREIFLTNPTGIDLIGFKPISVDFVHHITSVKFIGLEKTASKEEKLLFAAIFSKCEDKKLMAICSVTQLAGTYLAKLIPSSKYGGFYLCRIPFKDQMNDLHEFTESNVYDTDDENSLPINEEAVELMKRIIKKLRMEWKPSRFTNPGFYRQMIYIETLALDIEASNPDDSTLPDKNRIDARLANSVRKYEEIFGNIPEPLLKRSVSTTQDKDGTEKVPKFDEDTIRAHVQNGTLKNINVAALKSFARSIGIPASGLKNQLIEKITALYESNDAEN